MKTRGHTQKVVHGAIKMDVKKHEILVNGEPVQLTLKEFELLRRLLEHRMYLPEVSCWKRSGGMILMARHVP